MCGLRQAALSTRTWTRKWRAICYCNQSINQTLNRGLKANSNRETQRGSASAIGGWARFTPIFCRARGGWPFKFLCEAATRGKGNMQFCIAKSPISKAMLSHRTMFSSNAVTDLWMPFFRAGFLCTSSLSSRLLSLLLRSTPCTLRMAWAMISRRRGPRGMRDLQAHERFTYEAVEELLLLPIRATNLMNVLPPKNYWTLKKASWVAGGLGLTA